MDEINKYSKLLPQSIIEEVKDKAKTFKHGEIIDECYKIEEKTTKSTNNSHYPKIVFMLQMSIFKI